MILLNRFGSRFGGSGGGGGGGGGGGPPSGAAGGDLAGTYPNPTVDNVDPTVIAAGTAGIDISGNAATATAIAVGGITGLGTGVAAALAINVGTAGAFVVNGGALGTPASGALTNCTGLPAAAVVAGSFGAGNFTITEGVGGSGLTITGATQTTSQPVINATQTWNDAAVTFTALKLNVTSTASAAASKLMDLQVGGSSFFSVSKTGATIIGSPSTNSLEIVGGGGSLYLLGRYGGSGTNRASIWLNRVNGQSIVLNGNASGSGTDEGVYASAGGGGTQVGGTASCVLGGYFETHTQLSLTVKPLNKNALGAYTGAGHLLYLCGGKASSETTGGAGGAAYVIGGDAAGSGNNNGGDVILKGGAKTGSGTKGVVQIGEATTDLISLFGGTATAQLGSISDASTLHNVTGADLVSQSGVESALNAMGATINELISRLKSFNVIAT